MTTLNPLKAFNSPSNSSLFTAQTDFTAKTEKAVTSFLQKVDRRYQGRATVSETIAPCTRGRVHFQGSWWPARCEQAVTLAVGDVVQVVGRQNITLLVRPA